MESVGRKIYNFAGELFPICRSLTGNGVRKTIALINEYLIKNNCEYQIKMNEIPTGTKVFDWTVPKEWEITDGYVENSRREHIVDLKDSNLHIVGYSVPVDKWVSREELLSHIYTLPEQPNLVPYVTSYYKERFGFCMSENQKNALPKGDYHMYINSRLFNGSLTYGDLIIPGESEKEILFTTYVCHPSMANNECSGPALNSELINYISKLPKRRYTYRFVFAPETIGTIAYISKNYQILKKNVLAGFVISCVGDNRDYSIIESRYANTLADKALKNILNEKRSYSTYSFLKRGSDERQYNAPGVDMPVVGFCRSKYAEYPEYHTSGDNMDVVSEEGFEGSFAVVTSIVNSLESNYYYNSECLCEPQLGPRGLYPTESFKGSAASVRDMMNLLAYADGKNDLIDISNIVGVSVDKLAETAGILKANGLLSVCNNE